MAAATESLNAGVAAGIALYEIDRRRRTAAELTRPPTEGATMAVDRLLPTPEAHDLIDLVREICAEQLAPRASRRPRRTPSSRATSSTCSGQTGLLSLPFDEDDGGGGQPYEVYLQVLEEIASVWMSVAVDMSVHTLSASATGPVRHAGAARSAGCRACSAATSSAPTRCRSRRPARTCRRIATKAVRDGDGYVVNGTKAWISHGPHADFWLLFARTGARPQGAACRPSTCPAGTRGRRASARPRRRWG